MTYEDKVIDAVKQGFYMPWTPELEHLFRLVFRYGMMQAKIEQLDGINENA